MFKRSCYLALKSWRALSEKHHYDVCVIGGGPGGIAAAMRAVDYNKRVCLVEKRRIGGADLWNGTMYSKTLWETSHYIQKLKGSEGQRLFREDISPYLQVKEEELKTAVTKVSNIKRDQIMAALRACKSVDLIQGQATFNNDNEVMCYNSASKEYTHVSADYFIIATGSQPREHPFVPIDGELVVTSDHIMSLPLAKSLVVVGAGNIGCEFASIYAGFGKTKVSIIDKTPHILQGEDEDVVERVQRLMEEQGIKIHHNSFLYDMQPWRLTDEEIKSGDHSCPRSGVQYTIMNNTTRELQTFQVERALISIGRNRNYDGLGIENTRLRTRDGKLLANEYGLCDNTKNVYAIGDCCTDMFLVSMAEAQARTAIDHIYGAVPSDPSKIAMSMSNVAYLTQSVASVGLNETECRRRNIAYVAATVGYDLVSRTVAAGNTDGFVKIIVSDDARKTILGVRAIGKNTTTLVDLGSLAIYNNQTVYDLANRLTAYPSVSQAFQECLHVILGTSELKPNTFETLKLTRWSPDHFNRGVTYQDEERKRASENMGRSPVVEEVEVPQEPVAENVTVAVEEPVQKESEPPAAEAETPAEPQPEEPKEPEAVKAQNPVEPEPTKKETKEEITDPFEFHTLPGVDDRTSIIPGTFFKKGDKR